MTLRKIAAEAWAAERDALAAEERAEAEAQAERDAARKNQRYRHARQVLRELLGAHADEVELVDVDPPMTAHTERSAAISVDGVLFVWTEGRNLAAPSGDRRWEIGHAAGILEVYGDCNGCGRLVSWGLVTDLADVGQLLEVGPPDSHVGYDHELEMEIVCTANRTEIAEARAAKMERDATDELPRCSAQERRLLDTFDELYGRF